SCVIITDEEKKTIIPGNVENKIFESFLKSLTGKVKSELSADIAFMLTNATLKAQEAAESNAVININTHE
ncbi:hypothetical protein KAH27_01820, partial [bacterium]|nr:hypothetical protein [bacterium]